MIRKLVPAAVVAASICILTTFAAGGAAGVAAAASLNGAAAKPTPARPVSTSASATKAATAGARPAVAGATPSAGFPTTPPAQICGNTSILNGPATQPAGSVMVDPTQNLYDVTNSSPAGTTFWLSPGTYTLGTAQFGQVIPKDNDTYIGAPGAILDGKGINDYAFTQQASGVTIEYLTIQNFVPFQDQAAVNHDSGSGWTIQYNTMKDNLADAANAGNNSVFRDNCITANGQTGINGIQGIANVTIDHNEISFNGTGPNAPGESCGCEANVKLFGVTNVTITSNWVHDAGTQGLWGDTNAVGWLIEGNYINNNFAESIVFETSYNAFIHNNNFLNNTLGKGAEFQARNDAFPIATVYISESGGDSRVYGGKYATLEVAGNNFDNNYGGVTLWEDPNRFCNTVGNTAAGFCPSAGVATPQTCVAGIINTAPYFFDCRWHTQNVLVDNNTFRIDTDTMGCTGTRCGENSIFSTIGTNPGFSPYLGDVVEQAITFHQNNHFSFNNYIGNWNFDIFQQGNKVDQQTWQAAPYNQDTNSTFTPLPTANALDSDTSTLEGSVGHWVPWFSATTAQSTAEAHGGTHSLQINVTAANGWGVQLNNFPYYQSHPGAKVLTFWGKTNSGSGLAVTMQVTWRDNTGAVLQTDNVTIPALTATWQQGFLLSNAPAGTAYVAVALTNSTGVNGNTLFVDDVVVADNAPDTNTSTLEGPTGTTGHWVPWFSSTVSQSTAQSHSGTHSLQVHITAPFGWGVTLDNHPYFPEIPGPKTLSFWGRTASGSGLAATLQATWRDAYGNILQTDKVSTTTLTTTWQQAFAVVTAPPGTEYVGLDLLNSTGVNGNSIYLDDFLVVNGTMTPLQPPPPPSKNALDADTSTLEGSGGQWVSWFSCNVSQSTVHAHTGTHSLQVNVTAAYGWGVTIKNYPYFPIAAGPKTISFWGMAGAGSALAATMQVIWHNASGGVLQTNSVTIPALTGSWQQGSASVTAPAGTATVEVDLLSSTGVNGNVMYFDDLQVNNP
jgi:hypothetical protein